MNRPHDWDRVLGLYAKLERNEALGLNDDVHALCRRVARDVAISADDTERALLSSKDAEALVREMRHRIFEGSHRLSRAFAESDRRKNSGDVVKARHVLEEALAAEAVPLYRQHIMTMLDYVDEPEDE